MKRTRKLGARPRWTAVVVTAIGACWIGTIPAQAGPASTALQSGHSCQQLKTRGYGYSDAVAYWERWAGPPRMDADKNGIPCESVYAAKNVAKFFGRGVKPSGSLPSESCDVGPNYDRFTRGNGYEVVSVWVQGFGCDTAAAVIATPSCYSYGYATCSAGSIAWTCTEGGGSHFTFSRCNATGGRSVVWSTSGGE